jgi:hypothetical protein
MASSTRKRKGREHRPNHWFDGAQADTWHSDAPEEVVAAYLEGESHEGWEAWSDYLEAKHEQHPLEQRLPRGGRALAWYLPVALADSDTQNLIDQLGDRRAVSGRSKRRAWADTAADWLDDAAIAPASLPHAYECLAWAYALPRLPNCLGENLWWKLLNYLLEQTREAVQQVGNAGANDTLLTQLTAGELPVALAFALSQLQPCHELAAAGWNTLAEGVNHLVDADGLPPQTQLEIFPAQVMVWQRALAMLPKVPSESWTEATSQRVELALVHLARTTPVEPNFWEACRQLPLGKKTLRLAKQAAAGELWQNESKGLPLPSLHSEAHRYGTLRTDWNTSATRIAIDYSTDTVAWELATRGEVIGSGIWQLEVEIDGQPRSLTGPWETVCWNSDDDVDFLEIEATLGEGTRVQRQILLARQEHLLLLADVVLCDVPREIVCRSTLPLSPQVGFHGAEETREGLLQGNRARLLALPLALNEWRGTGRRGSLEVTPAGMVLEQTHSGKAAYAPLFIDLDRNRAKKACTWRQLYVADGRQHQPHDVAVGYRVQVGRTHWLVYRSLAERGMRSVLGQHVSAEFLFGRMKDDGDCSRLLEIEPIE